MIDKAGIQVSSDLENQPNIAIQPPLMELVGICKDYHTPSGELRALDNIQFTMGYNEFIAITGKSGAGKSTLINMITGIDSPTNGQIWYKGRLQADLDDQELSMWRRQAIGIVFQFFQLLPTINLLENVTIPMDFNGSLPLKERKNWGLHLLDQVGIADHAYKIPSKISGGQQQRVAIARALANDPPLIVADEPTGNLDSRTAAEIFELFAKLVSKGKTVFLVSHDRSINQWANRKMTLMNGKLFEK